MTSDDGWGEKCPDCGVTFPVLHGPHPTWVRCQPPSTVDIITETAEWLARTEPKRR